MCCGIRRIWTRVFLFALLVGSNTANACYDDPNYVPSRAEIARTRELLDHSFYGFSYKIAYQIYTENTYNNDMLNLFEDRYFNLMRAFAKNCRIRTFNVKIEADDKLRADKNAIVTIDMELLFNQGTHRFRFYTKEEAKRYAKTK